MNTIRKTHAGHWADNSTRFADLGAGVSHRQAEGDFSFSPDFDEADRTSRNNAPMLLAAAMVALPFAIAGVVLLVRYFLKA